jgi:hypothetical protein
LPHLARPVCCGVARIWARGHDVHVNGPPKSGPKPRRSMTSFCHFFATSLCLICV